MKALLYLLIFGAAQFFANVPTEQSSRLEVEVCQKSFEAQLVKLQGGASTVESEVERARLNFYLGRCLQIENVTDRALSFFEKGLESADAALALKSNSWEAVFWWGANKGSIADIKRNLGALKTIKTIEDKMLQMQGENPDYGYAGPNRVLGKIYQNAPRFISIGSSSKAEKALKAAYEKFPNFPGNVIALAEFYEDEGRTDEAKKLLFPLIEAKTIKTGDFGLFNVEKAAWEKMVQELLKKWGR